MAQNNELTSGRRITALVFVLALHCMNHAMFNMLTPLGLTLSRFFEFERISFVTNGFSLYLFFYGFAQIPMGFLSDRVSRKLILGAGAVLNGLAIAGVAIYPYYNFFIFCMAMAGVGASAYHPVGASYLADLYRKARGSALGISGIGATVGLTGGPWLAGALNDTIGWRATFGVFSAVCILIGIAFLLVAADPARDTEVDISVGSGWNRSIVVFLALAAAVFTFREIAGWGGYYLIPVYCETIYGYSTFRAGFVSGLQSIGGFIAQPLGGYLSDRYGRKGMMTVFLLAGAVFMALIPYTGESMLIPMVLIYGLAYTATVPIIDAMIADRTPPGIRGGVFGIFMAAGIGFSALSPLFQSWVIDFTGRELRGFVMCFLALGGSMLVSMTFMFFFKFIDRKQLSGAASGR